MSPAESPGSAAGENEDHLTIHLVPPGGREPWSLRLSFGIVRRIAVGVGTLSALFSLLIGSWWFLAARAEQAERLSLQVAELESDLERVEGLARSLAEVEEGYERIRALFGPDRVPGGESFLPPPAGRAPTPADGARFSWPLTEPGFITQPLLVEGGTGEEHPGIDIAIAAGSYIRAAGDGVIVEVGEDPVYGRFAVIEHEDGYRSLYGHASRVTVEAGERVRRNQVIGLTGSTGQATAPHLHFEILLNGTPVDPLVLVDRP